MSSKSSNAGFTFLSKGFDPLAAAAAYGSFDCVLAAVVTAAAG
jgi:hypothetical protein